jgi:hypothetical protein
VGVSDGAPGGTRLVTSVLERVLRQALPDGVMDVRYLPWERVPVVRAELWAGDASHYARMVCGFLDSINAREWRLVRPMFLGGGLGIWTRRYLIRVGSPCVRACVTGAGRSTTAADHVTFSMISR